MASELLVYGFLGGALRAAAGLLKYGARDSSDIIIRVVYLGFAGIICAAAFNSFADVSAYMLVAPAYAGTDLLKSFYEIASRNDLRV